MKRAADLPTSKTIVTISERTTFELWEYDDTGQYLGAYPESYASADAASKARKALGRPSRNTSYRVVPVWPAYSLHT